MKNLIHTSILIIWLFVGCSDQRPQSEEVTLWPEIYDRFSSSLPNPNNKTFPNQLVDLIEHGSDEEKTKYSRIWAEYEFKIAALHIPDQFIDQILSDFDPLAFSLIENYYMANGCFFDEGQLLKNLDRIGNIPLIMVNGRYDMICPPVTAYRIHEKLPNSKLIIAESSGHWQGEKSIEMALLKAMREFE